MQRYIQMNTKTNIGTKKYIQMNYLELVYIKNIISFYDRKS